MKCLLGETVFDGEARQLTRRGQEVHLSPKAFDLLRILIERRPRALSKSELHDLLWPTTFVSDVNLASLVAEIRDALGDSARQSTFVRTAHRFGYAFCGAVSAVTEPVNADGRPEIFCWLIHERRRLPLRLGENVLGRDLDGIQIDSPTVSRHHARIVVTSVEAVLEDLASKNGTYLGARPVTTAVALKDGDTIRTGSVVFRFRMTSRGSTASWSGSRASRPGS